MNKNVFEVVRKREIEKCGKDQPQKKIRECEITPFISHLDRSEAKKNVPEAKI